WPIVPSAPVTSTFLPARIATGLLPLNAIEAWKLKRNTAPGKSPARLVRPLKRGSPLGRAGVQVLGGVDGKLHGHQLRLLSVLVLDGLDESCSALRSDFMPRLTSRGCNPTVGDIRVASFQAAGRGNDLGLGADISDGVSATHCHGLGVGIEKVDIRIGHERVLADLLALGLRPVGWLRRHDV